MVIDRESRTAAPTRRELRATEGLAASLLANRDEVLSWKDENPLRLVAAAVLDVNGRAVRKAIQERIVPEIVPSEDWENWWKVVQPAVRDSESFDYHARNGTRLKGTAPSAVESVSLNGLAPSSRKKGESKITWIRWFASADDVPMPKSPLRMSKDLAKELREQDDDLVPKTISRLCGEIEKRVFGANKSHKASPDAWVKLLSVALDRWPELPAHLSVSAVSVVGLTARLHGVSEVERRDLESLIKPLAKYTSVNADNSRVMADAILTAASNTPSETTALLEKIHILLSEFARMALWRHLITARSGQISGWLNNRWLNIPSAAEKSEVATSLLTASRDDDVIRNMDSLLSGAWGSENAEERHHLFNPITFGNLMHRALMPNAQRIMRELGKRVGENGASPDGRSLMSDYEEFIDAAAKDRLKWQGEDYENKLAAERGRLRDTEGELERTTTQLEFLRRENRTKRTEATLEITRDAIIVLGDALQGLAASDVPKSREVGNLESRIVLALSTLNANRFGEVGEIAPFNPTIHQADQPPEISTPVKIVAPGVRYSRGNNVSVAVVPMKVQREA